MKLLVNLSSKNDHDALLYQITGYGIEQQGLLGLLFTDDEV